MEFDLNNSIIDSQTRITNLKAFETLTGSADIPQEMKALFKHRIDEECDFLTEMLQDDLRAINSDNYQDEYESD